MYINIIFVRAVTYDRRVVVGPPLGGGKGKKR
jgi:hypothetical protein